VIGVISIGKHHGNGELLAITESIGVAVYAASAKLENGLTVRTRGLFHGNTFHPPPIPAHYDHRD
jgi:hypothetical protein